jgi:undecaprenyl-diphosphatase
MRSFWQGILKRQREEAWLVACLLVIAGLILAFALIAYEVMQGATSRFDRDVIMALRTSANPSEPLGPAWVQNIAINVTALGSFTVVTGVMIIALGYFYLTGARTACWLLLTAVLGGMAVNSLLKLVFARPRPDFVIPSLKVVTASFPSGHATLSAIAYLTLGVLLARTARSTALRIYLIAVGAILGILIGVSRVYLAVHYPTDVLAGWCLGTAGALSCWAVMNLLERRNKVETTDANF